MQDVQLGKTDLIVSRICFGCWQLSPRFWGEVPLGPWEDALRQAVDLGVDRKIAFYLLAWALSQEEITGIGFKQHGGGRFIHLDTLTEPEHPPRPTVWSYP